MQIEVSKASSQAAIHNCSCRESQMWEKKYMSMWQVPYGMKTPPFLSVPCLLMRKLHCEPTQLIWLLFFRRTGWLLIDTFYGCSLEKKQIAIATREGWDRGAGLVLLEVVEFISMAVSAIFNWVCVESHAWARAVIGLHWRAEISQVSISKAPR